MLTGEAATGGGEDAQTNLGTLQGKADAAAFLVREHKEAIYSVVNVESTFGWRYAALASYRSHQVNESILRADLLLYLATGQHATANTLCAVQR